MSQIQHSTSTTDNGPFFENLDSTRNADNLDGLVDSGQKSFAIIELWRQRKSLHPVLEVNMNSVVAGYFGAIQNSADTAQQGSSFASEAVAFCDRLIDGKDSLEVLETGLQDTMEVAESARERSKMMSEQFRQVRSELFQISKGASSSVALMASERTKMVQGLPHSLGNIHTLHDRPVSTGYASEMKASPEELEATLLQLLQVTEDLNTLLQHISHFIDWWSDITTSLVGLEMFLPKIRVDGSNQLRTESIKERWTNISQQYDSYWKRINESQDYHSTTATVLRKLIDHKAAAIPRSTKEGTAEEPRNAAARAAERRCAEEKQKAEKKQKALTAAPREKTERETSQRRDADDFKARIKRDANEAKRDSLKERRADEEREIEVTISRSVEGNSREAEVMRQKTDAAGQVDETEERDVEERVRRVAGCLGDETKQNAIEEPRRKVKADAKKMEEMATEEAQKKDKQISDKEGRYRPEGKRRVGTEEVDFEAKRPEGENAREGAQANIKQHDDEVEAARQRAIAEGLVGASRHGEIDEVGLRSNEEKRMATMDSKPRTDTQASERPAESSKEQHGKCCCQCIIM